MLLWPMNELASFIRNVPVRKFARGEIILHQDAELKHVYAVKQGIVKCYDISLDGTEQLIWLGVDFDLFPMAYVFDLTHRSPFFYSAFTDVEVALLDAPKLVAYLKTRPDLLFELCRTITKKYTDLHFRINATGKPKAHEKILHTLAFIADRYSQGKGPQRMEITAPLTHQDIASLVGLTRETTAITLKKLKDEGFVFYDKSGFIIYRQRIEEALW